MTTPDKRPEAQDQSEYTGGHTCRCGEIHEHPAGNASHRESCTSTLKFGDSCCCGTVPDSTGDQPCCGTKRLCR